MLKRRLSSEERQAAATAFRCAILLIALPAVLGMAGCFGNGAPPPVKNIFDVSLGVAPETLTIPAGGNNSATVNIIPSSDNTCLAKLTALGPGGSALPSWLTVTITDTEPSLPAHVPTPVSVAALHLQAR